VGGPANEPVPSASVCGWHHLRMVTGTQNVVLHRIPISASAVSSGE
jgi:hypothetical protein